jgi:hypothetical protein
VRFSEPIERGPSLAVQWDALEGADTADTADRGGAASSSSSSSSTVTTTPSKPAVPAKPKPSVSPKRKPDVSPKPKQPQWSPSLSSGASAGGTLDNGDGDGDDDSNGGVLTVPPTPTLLEQARVQVSTKPALKPKPAMLLSDGSRWVKPRRESPPRVAVVRRPSWDAASASGPTWAGGAGTAASESVNEVMSVSAAGSAAATASVTSTPATQGHQADVGGPVTTPSRPQSKPALACKPTWLKGRKIFATSEGDADDPFSASQLLRLRANSERIKREHLEHEVRHVSCCGQLVVCVRKRGVWYLWYGCMYVYVRCSV